MEAPTGRQMSQPRPAPCASMISLKLRRPVTEMMSKSWARLNAKCSHRAELTSAPALLSSALRRFFTSGRQDPQLVPALVQDLSPPRSLQPPSQTAARMAPAVTLLQEQTLAASGSSLVAGPTPPLGRSQAFGSDPS